MNNTPINITPSPSNAQPNGGDGSKLRRALRAKRAYSTLSIFLSILLCISIALNVALIMAGNGADRNDTAIGNNLSDLTAKPSATDSAHFSDSNTASSTVTETASSESAEELREPVEIGQIGDLLSDEVKAMFSQSPDAYTSLIDLLKTENRPKHVEYVSESVDETSGETVTEKPVYSPADVSFAYVDLTTGNAFGYNAEDARYTASIIKAPYVYAILREVEEFEKKKHDFDDNGTALYDGAGKALFEGDHPNFDTDGKIVYKKGEEKYDLSRKWTYNSKTMFVEGSGMIQEEKNGFTLTYLELIEYALKYSDNIALEQLAKVFGYDYYHSMAAELGIASKAQGFMHLSTADCIKFLCEIYNYFVSGSEYAEVMKNAMIDSNYSVMIPSAVLPLECAHKYGWDVDAYHDIGIVFHERPFAVAVMTDLDMGNHSDYTYVQKIVKAILKYHEESVAVNGTDHESSDMQGDING